MSRPDELPPVLTELGEQLLQASREVAARRQDERRRRRRRLQAIVSALAAIVVPSGALAVAGAFRDGQVLSGDPAGGESPARDPDVVSGSAVADPDGGQYPWALRIFTSAGGRECILVGRLQNGRIGRLENGSFRAFERDAPGACSDLRRQSLVLLSATYVDIDRTAIYGFAVGSDSVRVRVGRTVTRVKTHAFGSYLVVVPSIVDASEIKVTATIGGRVVTVPDP